MSGITKGTFVLADKDENNAFLSDIPEAFAPTNSGETGNFLKEEGLTPDPKFYNAVIAARDTIIQGTKENVLLEPRNTSD